MRKTLSLNQAAGLYLSGMLLVLALGSAFQTQSFSWGLIATEVVCILLPALLWLRWAKVPAKEGLRLQWPGWAPLALSLLLGVAAWFVGATLDSIMALIFGYAPGLPPEAYPFDAASSIMYFLALAVSAPIAEEIFFRGALQGALRQRGVRFGVLFTAALFVLFHFRLQGLVGIIPVALLLGYVVERSGSLYAGMLVHFGNNAMAAVYVIGYVLYPDVFAAFPFGLGLLLALVGGAVLLWLFARQPRKAQPASEAAKAGHLTLRFWWPLAIAAVLYALFAGLEFAVGTQPELLNAGRPLEFKALSLPEPIEMEYRILNPLGDEVGEAQCAMSQADEEIVLNCTGQVAAFDVTQGSSRWSDAGHTETLLVRWRAEDMSLLEYRFEMVGEMGTFTVSAAPNAAGTLMQIDYGEQAELALPAGALVHNEWAWRAMALDFSLGYAAEVTVGLPAVWQQDLQQSLPEARAAVLHIVGGTPLATPAGNFRAWQVRLDVQTAYYEDTTPHRLLRWENDYSVWEQK